MSTSVKYDLSNTPPFSKNTIINGNFDVWQRGDSFTLAASTTTYTTDRWWGYTVASATRVISKCIASNGNSRFGVKIARTAGTATTEAVSVTQTIESYNIIPAANKTVTLSYWARKGLNFSSTNNQINVYSNTGTSPDEGVAAHISPGWVGTSTVLNTMQAITSTLTKYAHTFTLGAGVKEMNIQFTATPVGTAAANAALTTINATTNTVTVTNGTGNNKTFTRTTGSFIADGWQVGDTVTTTNFTNGGNNSTFLISGVTATTLQVTNSAGNPPTLVNETNTTVTNLTFTTSNTDCFHIEQVQLEIGNVATVFEFRDPTSELVRCMRYWEQTYDMGIAANTVTSTGRAMLTDFAGSATNTVGIILQFKVPKRTNTYAITFYNESGGTAGLWSINRANQTTYNGALQAASTATANAYAPGVFSTNLYLTGSSNMAIGSPVNIAGHYTCNNEL